MRGGLEARLDPRLNFRGRVGVARVIPIDRDTSLHALRQRPVGFRRGFPLVEAALLAIADAEEGREGCRPGNAALRRNVPGGVARSIRIQTRAVLGARVVADRGLDLQEVAVLLPAHAELSAPAGSVDRVGYTNRPFPREPTRAAREGRDQVGHVAGIQPAGADVVARIFNTEEEPDPAERRAPLDLLLVDVVVEVGRIADEAVEAPVVSRPVPTSLQAADLQVAGVEI